MACWAADSGSTSDNSTCVGTCCQMAYPAGINDYVTFIQACLCGSGPCASKCSTDYCVNGTVSTNSCNTCINTYTAAGAKCDATTPTSSINTQCKADSACDQYQTCYLGCP